MKQNTFHTANLCLQHKVRIFYAQNACARMEIIMEEILELYYADNARKLRSIVDKILLKFGGLFDKDMDDFYSLANEVFVDAMKRCDESQTFDRFLYSCLSNKIKSEMTKRNREKRKADRMSVSLDIPVGGDEDVTVVETIAGSFDVEDEVFSDEDKYSDKMLVYLDRLSDFQKEVLKLTAAGYLPNEIKEELNISEKQYVDCYTAIRSYRNAAVLF